MNSLLSPPRPVLWFLFLFNLAVAVAAGFGLGIDVTSQDIHLDGMQQIMTSAGMGVVALGAGASLLMRRPGSALTYASSQQPGK